MIRILRKDRLWAIVSAALAAVLAVLVSVVDLAPALSGALQGAAITLLGFSGLASKRGVVEARHAKSLTAAPDVATKGG